jgi:hypothetical protein
VADPRELYAEQHGREKADRQAALARGHHSSCGEPKTDDHHPACRKYVEPVIVIDGQESLL